MASMDPTQGFLCSSSSSSSSSCYGKGSSRQLPPGFTSSTASSSGRVTSSSSSTPWTRQVGRCFRGCIRDKNTFAVAAVALALFATGVVLVATATLPGLGWALIVGSPLIAKLVMNKLKQPDEFESIAQQEYYD